VRFQPILAPLSHWQAAGLHQSREGLRTERGGTPPSGIPGPPLPRSSSPLSSLDPAQTPRINSRIKTQVDQLIWWFCQDSVSPRSGKTSPQSGLIPLGRRGVDPLLGTSKRSSIGQGLPRRGEDNCNNSSVSMCVNERLEFVAP
jgi:hypothetical protein